MRCKACDKLLTPKERDYCKECEDVIKETLDEFYDWEEDFRETYIDSSDMS